MGPYGAARGVFPSLAFFMPSKEQAQGRRGEAKEESTGDLLRDCSTILSNPLSFNISLSLANVLGMRIETPKFSLNRFNSAR